MAPRRHLPLVAAAFLATASLVAADEIAPLPVIPDDAN